MPLAPYITRLKAGGVEAEIGVREAKQLQASAAELPVPPPQEPSAGSEAEAETDAPTVQELISRDPPLGLAKLRIDLEHEVRQLYLRRVDKPMRRGLTLGPMIRELAAREVLPPEITNPLMEVSTLCNRAVHGEFVPREVVEEIADVGLRLLEVLKFMNKSTPSDEY